MIPKASTVVAPALAGATDEIRQVVLAATNAAGVAGAAGAGAVTHPVPAAVVPVGAGTHLEVGESLFVHGGAVEVRAPAGVAVHDAADMTVTVGAGTPVGEVAAALAAAGQECPLDPRSPHATVGGVLASGLSGHRRLRLGPLRDTLLEVRFVTGDGRLVQGGGPTVKNVSGYDLPRLLVGSLGTLGVMVQVTLRCRPLPAVARWFSADTDPSALRDLLFAPSSILWDGRRAHVLLEGHAADVAAQAASARLEPVDAPPPWPSAPDRGRVSVVPAAISAVVADLRAIDGCRVLAEVGVGTVHVACDTEEGLAMARAVAHRHGGWMLREAGAPDLDGFGCPLPNAALLRRIKHAFDPAGVLSPGRLPL